jgi:transcriptional regulator with XRE-family HTH domain
MNINLIKKWREQLGLSQAQIANYLGISRSMWKFYEGKQRNLPTQVLLKLDALMLSSQSILLENNANDQEVTLPLVVKDELREVAKKQLKKLELTESKLLIDLKKLQEMQAQLNTQYQLWSNLLAKLLSQNQKIGKKEKLFYEIQLNATQKKLKKISMTYQMQKVRLEGCLAEKNKWNELLYVNFT